MTLFREHPELLEPFQAGETEALHQVYNACFSLVERVAENTVCALFAGESKSTQMDLARDLIQETFTRVLSPKARRAYDATRSFEPYVVAIARNLARDWARKHGRRRALLRAEAAAAQEETADSAAETPFADPWTMEVVEAYIGSLEGFVADVYQARYVRGLSQVEAAAELKVGRQRIRTAEKRLRAELSLALGRGSG